VLLSVGQITCVTVLIAEMKQCPKEFKIPNELTLNELIQQIVSGVNKESRIRTPDVYSCYSPDLAGVITNGAGDAKLGEILPNLAEPITFYLRRLRDKRRSSGYCEAHINYSIIGKIWIRCPLPNASLITVTYDTPPLNSSNLQPATSDKSPKIRRFHPKARRWAAVIRTLCEGLLP